ncbi:MAG: PAS domain S-box protein [Xanthomonadaceae bacterium]|nr:PAS domain S-box protein [Xanthomonadaceae bacterium]
MGDYGNNELQRLKARILQLEGENRELAASRNYLRAILDSEPACVKLLSADGSLLDMNSAGLDLLEADSLGQVRNHCVYPLVVEEHRAAFRDLIEHTFLGNSGSLEFEIIGFKGRRRWLETHSSPLRDAAGTVTAVIGITKDITERVRAEQSLRETESRLSMAVEASNTGLWNWNLLTNEVYFSPIWKRQIGYADDEIGNQFSEWVDRIHPDDRESALESCNAYLQNPTPLFQNTFRMRHKDGSWRHILTNAALRFNEQGQKAYVIGAHVDITERVLIDRELHEVESRLALAVDAANTGLWDWNLHDNTVFYSPIWKRQLGYADDEISNRFEEWQSRVHPDDLAPALARIEAHLKDSSVAFENEFRMRHKDGSWRWILAYGSLRDAADGQRPHVLGAHIDITERKRAELALSESSQKFAAIFSQALSPTALMSSPDYRFVEVNQAWVELFGFARAEVVGRTGPEIGLTMDVEKRAHFFTELEQGKRLQRREIKVLAKSGKVLDVLANASKIDINGKDFVLSILQDVTETREAEARLARHEELLRLFVQHSPAAMAMFDRDMRYIVNSRRYAEDFHGDNHDLKGRCHYDVFPEIPERWKQVHARCQAGASESCEREEFLRADGQVQWVRWQIVPWHESNGAIGGIILFTEDVTARVMMEKQLEEAADRQKTLALRLAEAQELAQKRLSVELHDRIGQNLTALGINLTLIEGTAGKNQDTNMANRLRDSRELLRTTTASVRSLIAELRPAVLDDYGLLAGLHWYAEQVHERTGLTIDVTGAESEPRLQTQFETTLFRIAQEVLNNAIKHAQASRIKIDLACNGRRVTLGIADDGRGFDPAAHRLGPRVHWGLEMIAERARSIGASLQVDSAPGAGTRVAIALDRDGGP